MKRPFQPRRSSSRLGVTAVEFALIVPVLFTLIFGIFEFTRVTMVQQALTNAAREGCRTACLATTQNSSRAETQMRGRLENIIAGHGDSGVVRISFNPTTLTGIESATPVTTSVEVDYESISLLPAWLLANSTLRVEVTMNRE
jgi:Flp pilus assembly protein TadG